MTVLVRLVLVTLRYDHYVRGIFPPVTALLYTASLPGTQPRIIRCVLQIYTNLQNLTYMDKLTELWTTKVKPVFLQLPSVLFFRNSVAFNSLQNTCTNKKTPRYFIAKKVTIPLLTEIIITNFTLQLLQSHCKQPSRKFSCYSLIPL